MQNSKRSKLHPNCEFMNVNCGRVQNHPSSFSLRSKTSVGMAELRCTIRKSLRLRAPRLSAACSGLGSWMVTAGDIDRNYLI